MYVEGEFSYENSSEIHSKNETSIFSNQYYKIYF